MLLTFLTVMFIGQLEMKLSDFSYVPHPGQKCILYDRENPRVMVATDFFAYGEMVQAQTANDLTGIAVLMKNDRVLKLALETPVIYLNDVPGSDDLRTQYSEVRILDGSHKDKKVYVLWTNVLNEAVQKRCGLLFDKRLNDAEKELRILYADVRTKFPVKKRKIPLLSATKKVKAKYYLSDLELSGVISNVENPEQETK